MKNVQIFTIFLLTGLLNLVSFSLWAANPLFTDIRTADPAACLDHLMERVVRRGGAPASGDD